MRKENFDLEVSLKGQITLEDIASIVLWLLTLLIWLLLKGSGITPKSFTYPQPTGDINPVGLNNPYK